MGMLKNLLKGDRSYGHHDQYDDHHYGNHRGYYKHGGKHFFAAALMPYLIRLLRNKTFLVFAGIACVVVVLCVVALLAVLAPLAIKLVKLIEQNGIKGLLDFINTSGLKGLLDFISQILGLAEKAGGK